MGGFERSGGGPKDGGQDDNVVAFPAKRIVRRPEDIKHETDQVLHPIETPRKSKETPHSLETEEERFQPLVRLLEALPQFGPLEPRQEQFIETKFIPQLEPYTLGDLLTMIGPDPEQWQRESARFHAIARRIIQDIEDLQKCGGSVPDSVKAAIAHYQTGVVPMG